MLAAALLCVMLAAVLGVMLFTWGYRCGEEHRIVKPVAQSPAPASFFMPEADQSLTLDGKGSWSTDEAPDAEPTPTRIPLRI